MESQENPETSNEDTHNKISNSKDASKIKIIKLEPGLEERQRATPIYTKFVKNVNLFNTDNFTRTKKIDELLRALSDNKAPTVKTAERKDKFFGCFQISTKKNDIGREPSRSISLEHRIFFPYLNYSFYHYKRRSKLEGLNFIPHKIYHYGEQGSGFQTKSGPQDFYQIRTQCLSKRNLFDDPEFPPKDSSLYYTHNKPDRKFEWKRPKEIARKPQLFVNGFSRFGVQQGELGDCWLLAAVATLTLYEELFYQIVPQDQGFNKDYAGIFHFRFWQYGRWVDVVVDDRLPTFQGELIFLHSKDINEFWSALLEKAYAKLHGSYESLRGGSTCEAMEDLTGGVTELYDLDNTPPNLFKILLKAYERWSLMACSINPDPDIVEAETPEGLIKGHAYSITKVQYVDINTPKFSGKIPLIRLRNPWGNEAEWNGPWSNHSPEWEYISDKQKKALGLVFHEDGEFWMTFKDFMKHFDRLEICNLNPDTLTNEENRQGRNKKWVMSVFEGEWVRGVTAGGCRNYLNTFWHNPQYRITLNEPDEGDEGNNYCTLIVALMQKNRRQMRRNDEDDLLTIGFVIYYLPDKVPKPLDLKFFKYNASVARSPSFINLREISCRYKLPKGTYCIVPSTFEPNQEGEFLLRVFSEHRNNMEEHDQEVGLTGDDDLAGSKLSASEVLEDELVFKLFKSIAGKDEEAGWTELKEILDYYTRKETKNRGFSKDVCRSMIAMLDTDRTGKLNFEQFKKLWMSIRVWKDVFKKFEEKRTGTLTGFQLRDALKSAGYTLNNSTLNILMHRYGNKNAEIEFEDFIMCAVKLKTMIELFKEVSSPGTEDAVFDLEAWIEHTLYA